jgi:Flp pilus assembly protein TadG
MKGRRQRTGRLVRVTRRLHDNDGASAVEFGLVLPILVLLLFGAITFGVAFNSKMQLNHAAREASRFAATLPDNPDWYEQVVERIVGTAAGQANVTNPTVRVCISVESGGTVMRLEAAGNASHSDAGDMVDGGTTFGPSSATAHCENDGLSGNRVQVHVSRDARLDAVFFRRIITLESRAVAYYEAGVSE